MSNSRQGRSGTRGSGSEQTLDATMRAPSTTTPDIVVIEDVDVEEKLKIIMNPKKDLWLSTVDGRHQSPIIPVRVGACADTFYVHHSILTKAEYFRKALGGGFEEAEKQAIDLPEEDPNIFSFVVAYLYENSYKPVKAVADVLAPEPEKGKGRESQDGDSTPQSQDATDSDASGSDASARSRRLRGERRRRRQRTQEEQERNRKEPGRHRPDCACGTCAIEIPGLPCWNCGVTRLRNTPLPRQAFWHPNPMPPPPPPPPNPIGRNGLPLPPGPNAGRRGQQSRNQAIPEPRMSEEDVRTWIMTYELSVEVYLCAERYLMTDFKSCISESIIDSFEVAGVQAARPEVLISCRRLHAGTSVHDLLVKKIFARVGFLLARLWKNFPLDTHNFWMDNVEVGSLIMKETMVRREQDAKDELPPMDRPVPRSPASLNDPTRGDW